ncbi:DUF397 domain-containing protein [Actinomadura scrupuli]|uniref:DUF397 domain-containing protein n=1 Tax=Actinomadura scrupuli TaxID=559629 RepID=UPI003D985831
MTGAERPRAGWRRSRRSGGNGGSCVEVAALGRVIAVRDSKDPCGPVLTFGRPAWSRFLAGLRRAGPLGSGGAARPVPVCSDGPGRPGGVRSAQAVPVS